MTEEIFRRDGYMFEFETTVTSVEGDLVELESTAFYPGGGGQVCDTGTIRGKNVTEVMYDGNRIIHKVPGNTFKTNETVWCSVDWNRRYNLMQGHTGEHLLFCALKRQEPDLNITKIYISPESKYVIVDRDVSWDKIGKALKFANMAIRDNLPVTKTIMSRNDPELSKVRIKLDRIDEEEITVVSIGDIDCSACSGIHVMETSELEYLLVYRKVSAGKDGVSIHFEIGRKAEEKALDLSSICLQAAEAADSKPELLVRTVNNMKHDNEIGREAVRASSKQLLAHLEPEKINGVGFYSGKFSADRKNLIDAAEKFKSEGSIVGFVSVVDTVSVILASGDTRVNCREVLHDILKEFGGHGGGKPDFAQGGIENADQADALLKKIRQRVKNLLL